MNNGIDNPVKQTGNRNLKGRFPKGVSGNPKGRPKNRTLTELIRHRLQEAGKDGEELAVALARVFVERAIDGSFPFAKEIIDRMDGKVPDRIAGPDGGPIAIGIVEVIAPVMAGGLPDGGEDPD